MNELVGESGANRREIEQEKTCKKQEDKNEVQADLLVQVSESGANRRRQVYPKKPRYNLLTPDQLEDKKKAANVQKGKKGCPRKLIDSGSVKRQKESSQRSKNGKKGCLRKLIDSGSVKSVKG